MISSNVFFFYLLSQGPAIAPQIGLDCICFTTTHTLQHILALLISTQPQAKFLIPFTVPRCIWYFFSCDYALKFQLDTLGFLVLYRQTLHAFSRHFQNHQSLNLATPQNSSYRWIPGEYSLSIMDCATSMIKRYLLP